MSTNDTRTFFVALPIDVELGDRLGAAPRGVSLLVPEDRHLTIAFLGSVGEAAARARVGPPVLARGRDRERDMGLRSCARMLARS